jgi:hypothetical protein
MLASSPASILNRIFSRAGTGKREAVSENHALSSLAVSRTISGPTTYRVGA